MPATWDLVRVAGAPPGEDEVHVVLAPLVDDLGEHTGRHLVEPLSGLRPARAVDDGALRPTGRRTSYEAYYGRGRA